MEEGRKTLQIVPSKNRQTPSSWFVKQLRKKYDDPKEVSKFGEISKVNNSTNQIFIKLKSIF